MTSIVSVIFIVLFFKVFANDVCYWPFKEFPENCAEVFGLGKDIQGIYTLKVKSLKFEAQCIPDPINGPAWTVIQRRMDGSVDFFREWKDYENGFGDKHGEYWLGLKYIYEMLSSENYELWVQLISFDDEYRSARYGNFHLSNATTQYVINVNDYFGDAGDSLTTHNGEKFYTKDNTTNVCVGRYEGAWWMKESCYEAHLNGRYTGRESPENRGIHWATWRGYEESMKYAHMAIRPAKFSSFKGATIYTEKTET